MTARELRQIVETGCEQAGLTTTMDATVRIASLSEGLPHYTHLLLDTPAIARHLKQFLAPERGAVLEREGEPRHYFYRFSDPILQPFVVLNGLSEGLISDEELDALQTELAEDGPPTRPQSLF